MLLWSVVTRTHTLPSSGKKRGIRRGTQQATPAVTFYPLTESAQAPTNATSQIIQRGYTAPTLCAGPPSVASIAPASELPKRSRSVSRAPQLSAARHTSLRRRDLVACPTNHRRLSNSDLIGLTLLLVKAVIGPSLSKCRHV